MEVFTSAGYQMSSCSSRSASRLPKSLSEAEIFRWRKLSSSACWLRLAIFSVSRVRAGTTLHSLGRVSPASLPHQRMSGPHTLMQAPGWSLRISA